MVDGVAGGPISAARQEEARSHLAAQLRSISLDLLGLYDSQELPPECAAWVHTTIEAAVSGVGDPAIAAVAQRLREQLAAAPAEIVRRIDQAKSRHEAGYA